LKPGGKNGFRRVRFEHEIIRLYQLVIIAHGICRAKIVKGKTILVQGMEKYLSCRLTISKLLACETMFTTKQKTKTEILCAVMFEVVVYGVM